MPRKRTPPAEVPLVAPQRPAAGPDRGRGARRAAPSRPTHDARGKFTKGNGLGGRPPGAKDTRPRKGTIRAVIEDLIANGDGHGKMVRAFDKGIQAAPAVAVKFLDLGAKVLDKAEEGSASKQVHYHLHTNVNFPEPEWPVGGPPALVRRNGQEG